jgi:GNAT superfamily N-acetyltransferase
MVRQINDLELKRKYTKEILEDLVDWFGVEKYRKDYIDKSESLVYFLYQEMDKALGFLMVKETSKDALEIHCMGVLKAHHGKGYGKALVQAASKYATEQGYKLLQVKTVAFGHYDVYDQSNLFYQAMDFHQLEIFPTLWDEHNPCLLYVKALEK